MHSKTLWIAGLIAGLGASTVMSADAGGTGAGKIAAPKSDQGKAAAAASAVPRLSVAQILERHVAARGGVPAWHAVQTMSWSGKMDAGVADSPARSAQYVKNSWGTHRGKPTAQTIESAEQAASREKQEPQVQLPFVLDLKRPDKSRVEIVFAGKTAVQVYDGTHGWKLRPYLNRNDVEPFTATEEKSQAGLWDLDGPLLDAADRGTKVEFDGIEPVDAHPAYRLKLTLKGGRVEHIWIDAQSFLDVKVEGTPRWMDGRMHAVWVYQRDFRAVDGGVKIPFVLETVVDGYPDTHKMAIDKVAVNPKLDDTLFSKPKA